MKNLSIISILLFFSILSFSQSIEIDHRLEQFYGEEYLQELSGTKPEDIKYLNWYLDNSYSVNENINIEKYELLPYLKHFDLSAKTEGEIVEDIDLNNFNILFYSIERYYDKPAAYRIGNSGKIIYFDSVKDITAKYNKFLGY
ncbi:MAG: hypothetical protein LBQ22_08385 [Bacteroidales bacterium]|jgi:hypothetical protein|nr:hypothetical protein [Bacteroidales bacterium]